MLTNSQIVKILKKSKLLPEKRVQELLRESKQEKKSLGRYLLAKNIIDEMALCDNIAKYFNVPFVNLKDTPIRKDILFLIPEALAHTHKLIAFDKNDKEVKIATVNPDNLEIFDFLKKKTGLKISVHVATEKAIENIIKQYHKSLQAEFRDINTGSLSEGTHQLAKLAEDLPIVRVVDTLLEYAIYQEASDIHIEPGEEEIVVRYRIDGILQDVMHLPKNSLSAIIARIKIMANLKVDEHRLPQDGRFKIYNDNYKVSFRVSIIPTADGEKIVLRLLNEKAQIMGLEQLGFQPASMELVKRTIKNPNGMILSTGPTGSGKTTTLYTILNALNKPEVNISTIEDPIEYRIERINQTQINPKVGLTFAIGLRALLRQDPDIIMVGEIRDEETADIAIHSALTGHLVLSTLHTNNAVSSLYRLRDMGVPSFLISSTVNLIIAQRLVRKICPNCIQSLNLSKEIITDLSRQLNIDNLLKKLENEKTILANNNLNSLLFYHGKGCEKCNHTGYKGRIGVYETLEITPTIRDMINEKVANSEIEKQAEKQNMINMVEDGFIKAINGITTLEEIMRVAKE